MAMLIDIDKVKAVATQLADCLRSGYQAQGHDLTIEFIDLLSKYIEQENIDDPLLHQLFTVMLDAQQRGDGLFFADIIQYELFPKLG